MNMVTEPIFIDAGRRAISGGPGKGEETPAVKKSYRSILSLSR
jgi:hypothetical protein